MSELPEDLRALLSLAKDGHDPIDPAARVRVRHAVAVSLLMTSGSGASTNLLPNAAANNMGTLAEGTKVAKAGWALFGSKVATLTAGTAAVVGLSLASYQYAPKTLPWQTGPSAKPAHATTAAVHEDEASPASPRAGELPSTPLEATGDATAGGAPVRAPEKVDPRDKPAQTNRPHRAAAVEQDLAAEMALVRAASQALAQGDQVEALTLLHEHAQRFANGSLRLEREGLRAIAECSRASGPSRASAKRFLRLYPHSLMSARVTKACLGE